MTRILSAYFAIAGGMALCVGMFMQVSTLWIAGMALLCAAGLVL